MPPAAAIAIRTVILRELRGLDREIAAYPDDATVWETAPGISNSAGNLALHLAGNLRHFIGSALGGASYVRDRDAEFSTKNLSRDELREIVASAMHELDAAFDKITDEQFDAEYPLPVLDHHFKTSDYLIHLAVHLSYHLGQIDYHRRLLTGSAETVNTVNPRELNPAGRS
jgi:uncharacterized damage-inducible protein DinB